MRGKLKICLGVLLVAAFLMTGCGRVGGPPGYIDNLNAGASDRNLGKHPGVADDDGMVTVRVVGKGLAPEDAVNKGQSIILGERAAIADGYRQLAERIKGIYIDTYTKVYGAQVDYDQIHLETATWLRGARVTKIETMDHGITAAHMEARIHIAPDHLKGNQFPRKKRGLEVPSPAFSWWPW